MCDVDVSSRMEFAVLYVQEASRVHVSGSYDDHESDFDDEPIYDNVGSTLDTSNVLGLLPGVSPTDCSDYYCFVGEMGRAQCKDYMQGAADGEFLVRQNQVIMLNHVYLSVDKHLNIVSFCGVSVIHGYLKYCSTDNNQSFEMLNFSHADLARGE